MGSVDKQADDVYKADLPEMIRAQKYADISGVSTNAIKKKRETGVWPEGEIWVKAPDGNVMINWRAADRWHKSGSHSIH